MVIWIFYFALVAAICVLAYISGKLEKRIDTVSKAVNDGGEPQKSIADYREAVEKMAVRLDELEDRVCGRTADSAQAERYLEGIINILSYTPGTDGKGGDDR